MYELQKHKLQNPFEETEFSFHKSFPSQGHLAKLSHIVYYQSKSRSQFPKKENAEDFVKEWIVLAIYSGEKILKDGYFGAAYFHRKTKHLVICHSGTKLKNSGTMKADWDILLNRATKQVWSAYLFTRAIIIEFSAFSSSITTTGHSLGGWLSQTTAFLLEYPQFLKPDLADPLTFMRECVKLNEHLSYKIQHSYQKSYHIHTVVFDTPGVKGALEGYMEPKYPRYEKRVSRELMLDALDITCYLSAPNPINSFGLHIGAIYAIDLFSDGTTQKPLKFVWELLSKALPFRTLWSCHTHSISKFVEFWNKYNENGVYTVDGWPSGFLETERTLCDNPDPSKHFHSFSLTKLQKTEIYPLSIFDQDEKKFLKNISNINSCRKHEPAIPLWSEIIQNTTVSDYFESFEICESNRLKLLDNTSIDLFLLKTKWLVKSKEEFQTSIELIISDHPKIYEVIYETVGKQYMLGLPKYNCNSTSIIHKIRRFLLANDTEFVLTCNIHQYSDNSSVAMVYSCLKNNPDTKHFTESRTGLFLDINFLQILDSQVSLDKVLYSCQKLKQKLKLIVVKCETGKSELVCLLKNVVQEMKSIKLLILAPDRAAEIFISDEDLKIEYSMLDDTQKVSLLNTRLNFQGYSVVLKDLVKNYDFSLDSSVLWQLLMPTSEIVIGEPIPNYFEEIYIDRNFKQMILENNQKPVRKNEVFFINGANVENIKNFFHLESSVPCQLVSRAFAQAQSKPLSDTLYFIVDEQQLDFETILSNFLEEKFGGHLFRYEFVDKARLVYESSFGLTGSPSIKLKTCDTELVNESIISNLSQKVKIIVDEPGMGKSTILKHFAQKYQTQEGTNWSFFIDLASWKNKLRDINTSEKGNNEIFNYLFEESHFRNLELNILRNFLKQGRVSFFFDSFDEISQDLQDVTVNIITSILKNSTKAKIWIACRPHLKEFLESRFGTFALALSCFPPNKRVEFLAQFWINHTNFRNLNLSTETIGDAKSLGRFCAESLLFQIRYSLEMAEVDDFIGIPLQLYMIGNLTVSQFLSQWDDTINKNNLPKCSFKLEFNSIFELYQLFVVEKYRLVLEEKIKVLSYDWPWHFRTLADRIAKIHRLIAFSFYFPDDKDLFTNSETQIVIDEGSMVELNRVGIIYKENQSYKSVHPTLTEYFVAEFIVSKLLKLEHTPEYSRLLIFLKRYYFNDFFDKIRYFMDHFIAYHPRSNPIFKKCLQWDNRMEEIFEHLEYENDMIDFLGRTVLHYAMIYGDHRFVGILWIIIQNQHLIQTQDKLGTTFASCIPLSRPMFFRRRRESDRASLSQYLLKYSPFKYIIHPLVNISKLDWIVWFIGESFERFTYSWEGYEDMERIFRNEIGRYWSDLENHINVDLITKLESKFGAMIANPVSISIDLNVFAVRGYVELDDSVYQTICPFTIENTTKAFEAAITLAGKKQVIYAMELFRRIGNPKLLSELENSVIQVEFLELLFKENCLHYRTCLQYISVEFEHFLWRNGNKAEIFDVMLNNNMISLVRAMSDCSYHKDFVIELLKYPTCAAMRKKMMDCVVDSSSRIMNFFWLSEYPEMNLCWNFFDTCSQEKLLKRNYNVFSIYIIAKLRNITDLTLTHYKFNVREAKFLTLVYNSVNVNLKDRIAKHIGGKSTIRVIEQLAEPAKNPPELLELYNSDKEEKKFVSVKSIRKKFFGVHRQEKHD